MLDSFYHMTLELLKNRLFGMKTSRFWQLLSSLKMYLITLHYKICKPLVVYQSYCMALYHSQTRHHVLKEIIYKPKTYNAVHL